MKIRIRFNKTGAMKFVGHLDLLRYFQKAFRRSGFQMLYSKGFNPHQAMSFAAPLAIGYTSEAEYVDIGLEDELSEEEGIARLNANMADGIQITGWKTLEDNSKNAMSIVHAARYVVTLRESFGLNKDLFETVHNFISQDEILIMKKTKSSEKVTDIKSSIFEIKVLSENSLELVLATGSVLNLKPELVMEAISKYLDIEYKENTYAIHRIDIYVNDNDKLVSLYDTNL
ncbi:MAG: Fe-S oxidoreductase [Clostridiales bacterium]|jgi:radical SAM-linked protein|nr:Fe-S oxidoreductase [Clostridiales bacterium]